MRNTGRKNSGFHETRSRKKTIHYVNLLDADIGNEEINFDHNVNIIDVHQNVPTTVDQGNSCINNSIDNGDVFAKENAKHEEGIRTRTGSKCPKISDILSLKSRQNASSSKHMKTET